ncbi:unnamed protein product [Vitrella brassicaformis CCMP3155]|uniref:Uncharacterized protein n=1 Tax=Vitrella brassicaformis (strain CCMP3155) TaxID=1169540 RepID=A0A0G4F7A8_VITBC|nr:unnamed protein product [Vitrella brassicaformis CCMP3155]|eukprot:CEM07990.1 unnamed protein product [Vitrella brassicaformis CCMP3155]
MDERRLGKPVLPPAIEGNFLDSIAAEKGNFFVGFAKYGHWKLKLVLVRTSSAGRISRRPSSTHCPKPSARSAPSSLSSRSWSVRDG